MLAPIYLSVLLRGMQPRPYGGQEIEVNDPKPADFGSNSVEWYGPG